MGTTDSRLKQYWSYASLWHKTKDQCWMTFLKALAVQDTPAGRAAKKVTHAQ